MSVLRKYVPAIIAAFLLAAGPARAQHTSNEGRPVKAETEQTGAANGDKKTTTTADKNDAGRKTQAPPPTEKKKWAIQVKQGAKWYQLSVNLVF